jgi:hypothetical protein
MARAEDIKGRLTEFVTGATGIVIILLIAPKTLGHACPADCSGVSLKVKAAAYSHFKPDSRWQIVQKHRAKLTPSPAGTDGMQRPVTFRKG